MKRVITYGTYDLFHYGHENLLRRARALGGCLIVGLSTDEFNAVKGKTSVDSYEKRKSLLESLDYVDVVFPEKDWAQKPEDIETYQADIFVMGSDWEGKFDWLNPYCRVIYLPRTEGISTQMLKQENGFLYPALSVSSP